jgi:gluconate 2-dehydrogenase gamma chain
VRTPPPAPLPRRAFLADSGRAVGAGLLALQLPWIAQLAACARADASRRAPFVTFDEDQARTFRALATQIIPSGDGLPGAEEAGAVYFADRALGEFVTELRTPITNGLADLDRRARRRGGGRDGFASLAPARQAELLREVEKKDYFDMARMLVVAGTFADPSYGGNRDGAGWRILDVQHRPTYQPPFGWYDADEARETPATPATRSGGGRGRRS